MRVHNLANLHSDQFSPIEAEIGAHHSLQDVLEWGFRQPAEHRCPEVIADFVVQDEFSHDVLVPWRDGLWLAYQST